MKNIAFGIGTSNGINRLKFVLEMPQTGFRSFIPVVKGIPAFNVVGKPNGVAIIGMPSKSDFISIEGSLAALSTPKTMEGYYKGKQVFSEKTGFSIEDIFATLGQDISLVSDEAGYYVVVRLKDAEKFNVMLNSSVKNFGLKYSKHKVGGHEYSHLRVPSINSLSISMAQEEAARKGQQANNDKGLMMLKRFLDVPSHIYWEQEGDYLVMASIPQVLMDRHYIQPHTPVNQWLKKEQRMDAEGALLLASMRNEGVPEFMYRMNLGMLSYLGDITERPVNMFALPTPREAQLPKEGTYGIKITSSETQLGFELAFEDNPLEFILAGSNAYQGVAVVGILAAIAIPAYQDYVVRVEMGGAFIGGKTIQSRLEIFELENGHFPNKEEIVEFDQNNMVTDKYSISINPDDGKIIVRVHNKSLSSANQLFMIPQKQDGRLSWKCESDIAKKYLPQSCR